MFCCWCDMREAAMDRHKYLNEKYEQSNPTTWAAHMAIVRGFYGW
jgi:hypothetical protein